MWNPVSSAPENETVVVYGYELQPVSGLRVPESYQVAFASQVYTGEWMLEVSEEDPRQVEFEPLGWRPVPELPEAPTYLPDRPLPLNPPLYKEGDEVFFFARDGGIKKVRVETVLHWPNGYFYGLNCLDFRGHGNPDIGSSDLVFDAYGLLYSRPAREDELKPLSEAEKLGFGEKLD